MTYCTTADIRLLTGISVEWISDTDMSGLIAAADRRCDARIAETALELPIASPYPDTLRDASAHWTAALAIDRLRICLSRPNSLSIEGLTFGTSPDTEIQRHEQIGRKSLEQFITAALEEEEEASGTIIYIVEGN